MRENVIIDEDHPLFRETDEYLLTIVGVGVSGEVFNHHTTGYVPIIIDNFDGSDLHEGIYFVESGLEGGICRYCRVPLREMDGTSAIEDVPFTEWFTKSNINTMGYDLAGTHQSYIRCGAVDTSVEYLDYEHPYFNMGKRGDSKYSISVVLTGIEYETVDWEESPIIVHGEEGPWCRGYVVQTMFIDEAVEAMMIEAEQITEDQVDDGYITSVSPILFGEVSGLTVDVEL